MLLSPSFSSQFSVYDKTVLVIPKPEQKQSLAFQTAKVFEPFTYGLWGVVIVVIFTASLFSVWFSDREIVDKKRYGQSKRARKRRKFAYFRLLVDAILEKDMYFFSAGIEQDTGASLPHKVLMFGFGFFILIAVSAYVANLAAFLTQSGLETKYGTMKEVIAGNVAICGHPALKDEIKLKWPDGNWVFPNGNEFHGLLDAYAREECQVLAIGMEDTIMDAGIVTRVCKLGLVYTDDVVIENPIAFPTTPQLAAAFSYWMYTAEKNHGVSLESTKQAFIEENKIKAECELQMSNLNLAAGDEFARVSAGNMIFPIMFFVICALFAAVLEVVHERKRKKGQSTSFGRTSSLDFYASTRKVNFKLDDSDDELVMPQAQPTMQRGQMDNSDVERGQICDFPGANVPGDAFHENGAPQSTPGQTSIFKGSMDDVGMINEDADNFVKKEENNASHRIEELMESGTIEEVLDSFVDFFQEMKKLKKDQ